jgi:hypothetical protein
VALGDEFGQDVGLDVGQCAGGAGAGEDQGAADGVQGGGEGDPVWVQAGAGGGQADDGADGLVEDEVGPEFLAGQVRGAAAQDAARTAEAGLEFAEPGLDGPSPGVPGGQVACGCGAPAGQRGDQPVPLGAGGAIFGGDGQPEFDDPDGDRGSPGSVDTSI